MSSATQYVGPNAVYAGGLTCLQQIVPAYVFVQFADDENIQAWFTALNDYSTQYLLWFNTLNLPIYTSGIVAGALLDWVGQGLYGIVRPSVTTGTVTSVEATNSAPTNTIPTNARAVTSDQVLQSTSDDIYRRVITWNFYKGDGFVFSIEWLKRRVYRFTYGADGISPIIDNTYNISVTVSGSAYTIEVITADSTPATLLNALINSGACVTPFQSTFTLSASTNLINDGGLLQVNPTQGWPTATAGLAAGALWDNGGVVTVVPGVTPNPSAPPVYFGTVSSLDLLALGGGNLPLTNPANALQLWNNGGAVSIS